MSVKRSSRLNRKRILLGTLLLGSLGPVLTLAAGGGLAGSVPTSHRWGMATSYNLIAPTIDFIFAGRFEGAPAAVNVPVHWEPTENNTGAFVPRLAGFRIDDVVKGPQELSGQMVTVRYAIVDYPSMAGGMWNRLEPLGVPPYTDIPTTVAGRRCLLLLKKIKDGPGDYQVAFNEEFMVAGEKPQVSGWADLAPMKRLEYEFASAVASPDPAVAYLATGSACLSDSPAAGPVLVAALKKNLSSPDARLKTATLTGLVTIGDLDTIYKLKDLLQEWRQDPATGISPKALGGFGPLSAVDNRNAVPALVELTSDPDASVRFGATYALRNLPNGKYVSSMGTDGKPGIAWIDLRETVNKDVISALAARLDDEDSKVRYQAIQGLANQLTRHEVGKGWVGFAPATDIYKEDPQTPVNNWKAWWAKNKDKYPSVDFELQKAALFRAERPWAHEEAPAQ
jgi:hypothetical protein